MKSKILSAGLAVMIAGMLTGCTSYDGELMQKREDLQKEIAVLEEQKESLENEITDIKVERGTEKYVITFNVSQSHFILDFENNIKDSMNDVSIEIPVDKEYYDSVEIGDVINDDFRVGSLIMSGSFGNWEITVEDKEIR